MAAASLTVGVAHGFAWPSSVDRIAGDLRAEAPSARRQAAKQLFRLPASAVRRLAPPCLDDSDPEVRIAALEALLVARAGGLSERILPWLGDADPRVRRAAAEGLYRAPSLAAVVPLGRILSDPDPQVRAVAARALGATESSTAVIPLLGRLDDSEPEVREAAASALSRIGDPSAVVPLIGKVQDPRPNVRRTVARALGSLGDVRGASALVLLLRDADESVRVAALGALGRLKAGDAVFSIVSLLPDERRPAVRRAAFAALGAIQSDAALDSLVSALAYEDPREDGPARSALMAAGERGKERLLQCLRGQPAPRVADGCALALGGLRLPGGTPAIAEALHRGVIRPRVALRALGSSGDPAALGTVVEYLGSDDPWIRLTAIEAASVLLDPSQPDGRPVPPVARALDRAHGRRAERVALVALLGKTGSPRAVPLLTALAGPKTDPALRLASVRALGELGRSGQDAVLLSALDAREAPIRLAAAWALRRTGSGSSLRPLLERLQRAAEQDREALVIAMAGPIASSPDPSLITEVERLARSSDGARRDALIETLAHAGGRAGSAPLERLLDAGTEPASRAKIAEGLGLHAEARARLLSLIADPHPSVRANAVWSLGLLGVVEDAAAIERLISDRDLAVASNAVSALGLLSTRGAQPKGPLCSGLGDSRAAVRAAAASALSLARARCDGDVRGLSSDPSDVVRAQIAHLLWNAPSGDAKAERSALERCAGEDPMGEVASACAGLPPAIAPGVASSVTVYVVPAGMAAPVPLAPFALVRADGLTRLGVTDRRGAVFEPAAPAGSLKLAVPPALTE